MSGPPAIQGDVRLAVDEGVNAIGLIDGAFESVAPVWHKEILYGLSKGVAVFGAANMGALRAAECHAFGMIGVGEIFKANASETLVDDADVALLHGPEELGYVATTIPMVNVDATLAHCSRQGLIDDREARCLSKTARLMFFKLRNWKTILASCPQIDNARSDKLLLILREIMLTKKEQTPLR